ncbi:titin homolog [Thamnophis elegans]|uniref:titin homolog n=1 Tax=Thamnophis elegans TaxID=35005 RepID=UPI001376CEEB|nr:titin homolog [Thamnophis elegans]
MEPEEGRKEDNAGNERLNEESTEGAEPLLLKAAELEGQDGEILGDGELNQGREAVSGEDGNYTEGMAEPELREVKMGEKSSLRELKSNAESKELGGGESEEKEHEEIGIVEESRTLEMDEKVDLAKSEDQREKEVHAYTEGKADYPHNLEKAEVFILDQKDSEGGTEKEIVETTEIQKEDNDLSRLGQGGNLEITEEGKDVAADATSVDQKQTEESVELGEEQNKVYIKAEDEEIAGVEQSLIARETETSVETQEKPEQALENLREPGEITGKRDATMADEEATTLHQTKVDKLVEGSLGESGKPVGEQPLTVVEAKAEYFPVVVETEEVRIGKLTTEEVVIIPVEDETKDLMETSEEVMGEKDLAAMEAVAVVEVENLVDISETQMGKEDMALIVESREKTMEELIAEKDVEVTEAPESISGIREEIPTQIQDKRSKEKTESEMIEEKKVEDLTQPEQKPKEQEEKGEQLDSAGMIDKVETGELEMALAINQNEMMESVKPSQEKAEIAVMDTVGEKLPAQEKILIWSPELERPGVDSRLYSGISRSYKQEDKLSRELIAELVRIGQGRRDLSLGQVALLEASIKLTGELEKLGSEEQSHKVKGKIIIGLAGLRQGPIKVTPRRTIRSAGGYRRVLAQVAPGLIVTGLRKPDGKRLTKQDHLQLYKRALEQRETRSAEQGRFGVSKRSDDAMVFMGYRIGRERMSCLSEAEQRMMKIKLPKLEEIGGKPAIEQGEVPKQKQEVRKEKIQEINGNEDEWHQLEELPTAWLGRPLTRGYTAAQQSSGWTAGIRPGHVRISRSLRAAIKKRINLMVMGESATKSAAQRLEPLNFGMRRRMLELTSKSDKVHWLNEILKPKPPGFQLGVADQKVHEEGSPNLMTERQSPGLFTRKKELKDWRDGVMGIAIRRYNAMRLAMWGEGPIGLHVKGRKLTEDSYGPASRSDKVSSILGQVERRVLTMAQQVTNEKIPGLEVGGKSLAELLKQDMELARSKKGEKISR